MQTSRSSRRPSTLCTLVVVANRGARKYTAFVSHDWTTDSQIFATFPIEYLCCNLVTSSFFRFASVFGTFDLLLARCRSAINCFSQNRKLRAIGGVGQWEIRRSSSGRSEWDWYSCCVNMHLPSRWLHRDRRYYPKFPESAMSAYIAGALTANSPASNGDLEDAYTPSYGPASPLPVRPTPGPSWTNSARVRVYLNNARPPSSIRIRSEEPEIP